MSTRQEKLVLLQKYYNLETGYRDAQAFEDVDELFDRACKKKSLDCDILNCTLCKGMNASNQTEAAVGYGDIQAKIFMVGQSLCTACMNTRIPFTAGSGYLIDAVLTLAGLKRKDIFITNVVHCHPPSNRASTPEETKNCRQYLIRELEIVKPALIVTLGVDARESLEKIKSRLPATCVVHNVKHPAAFLHSGPEGVIEWIINLATKIERYK